MHEIFTIAVKGLAGGTLVVAFALLCQGLTPKRFAGLFSAAPAVALAGLSIVLLDKGHHAARGNALGMIAGSVGMVFYALAVVPLLRRMKGPVAAAAGLTVWFAAAGVAVIPFLVG